jgi:hypothetical protein
LCPYQGCMRQPERQLTTADRHCLMPATETNLAQWLRP